jgi:23S rRNA (adenine-N6)-dimethyltransferase
VAGQRPRRLSTPPRRLSLPPAGKPNAAGAHFLRDRGLIGQLVRSSGAGDGDLVLDLGAGYGAITSALAQAGARVVAVERDPKLAGRLERRFGEQPGVRVIEADLRVIPLPRREFLVVANPPFSATTALLRRLLGDREVPLAGADLILAWGVARWLTSARPRDAETARWTARYEVRLVRRVAAASFAPAPSVDAAHIAIRPRAAGRLAGRKAQLPRWSHDRRS